MAAPRLRIAHLAGTLKGAPWMVAIMREQRRRGHEVMAVLPPGNGCLPSLLAEEGFRHYATPMDVTAGITYTRSALNIFRLALLLRRLRVDVAQYHLFPSIISGRMASWTVDVPLRFSMIPGTLYLEMPILKDIEVGTVWADTKVIATCERTRELYEEQNVPRERVELIYYGLDGTRFDPERADGARVREELALRPDQPVIGMVAYFYPPLQNRHLSPPHLFGKGIKGHDTVLRALPRVLEEFPDAKVVFVGKGWMPAGEAYEAQVRQLARDLGVDGSVIFAGERSDIADVLASFDIALQCSLCENLGGSIEALTMRRPLIASRVGGLVDSVKHERTGLLVEPENAEELAQAILRLLRDRAFGARLAENGRAFMREQFTVQRTCDDLDALYAREMAGLNPRRLPREQGYRILVTIGRTARLPFRVAKLAAMVKAVQFRARGGRAVSRLAAGAARFVLRRTPESLRRRIGRGVPEPMRRVFRGWVTR